MSSVFRKDDNSIQKPNRNTFDLSFANNLTAKFGKIIPVMVQPVMSGDSVRIEPKYALRFMPQVFPVQTRQRASLKFYYVRNRNLWKDWPDFIGKTKSGLVSPYIKFSADCSHAYYLRPSSVCDYMGVPVKINVPYGSNKTMQLNKITAINGTDYKYVPNSSVVYTDTPDEPFAVLSRGNIETRLYQILLGTGGSSVDQGSVLLSDVYGGIPGKSDSIIPASTMSKLTGINQYVTNINTALFRKAWKPTFPFKITQKSRNGSKSFLIVRMKSEEDVLVPLSGDENGDVFETPTLTFGRYNDDGASSGVFNSSKYNPEIGQIEYVVGMITKNENGALPTDREMISDNNTEINVVVANNPDMYWCDVALSEIPFANDVDDTKIRLSALPFRGFDSIYNALIRNAENNPLIINGQPEYNKYLISEEGGAVSDGNEIWRILGDKHCNWADDRFTTALPSPQQGNAPLVGLTGIQGATLVVGDEDGGQQTIRLQYDVETGNLTGVDASASSASEDLISETWNAVDYGISINDLRNVNSYQRWKENNIRVGYKYKDQILSHFGVSVRFDVLDMPEFIGGVTRDVNVEQITQTATTTEGKLGEYAGQSYIGGDGHSIEKYCDEHGYIIGLMSIYPLPLYQDVLPKHLYKNDTFDYYFPEFGKIGMQPITNKELAFSLSYVEGDMNGTFGYQRAWYDYLENLDEVHGAFRGNLRNFLIGRDFGNMPKLGESFLTISHDDLNNTFYVDDDEDKIIGQLYFDMKVKRPIPMVGIPALE